MILKMQEQKCFKKKNKDFQKKYKKKKMNFLK